jgi:branched-chain amino acid transport system substrate-binding protein
MEETMNKLLALVLALALGSSLAQDSSDTGMLDIGVVVSATGPAASLGIPERNTFVLLESMVNEAGGVGGRQVRFHVLDDASDTTQAVRNARSLIEERNVVAIIGTTTTPASLGMIDVVAEVGVPMISMAASRSIIAPVDEGRFWVFKTPQTDEIMANAIVRDMVDRGVATTAFIGFNDAYGEGWWNDFSRVAEEAGISVVASERYARTDTSVTGQILRITAQNPDAVLIGASGTPAALPQRSLVERGYGGTVYQTHGVANPDFLRVGGADVEGTILPAGPILVAEQLPDGFPTKEVGLEYIAMYEAEYGEGSHSTFGAHAYDAWLILGAALERALEAGSPDDLESFRSLLRDEIEATQDLIAAHGVFSFSPEDHLGLTLETTAVMVTIEDGGWRLLYTFAD